jgi:hypothetical protein
MVAHLAPCADLLTGSVGNRGLQLALVRAGHATHRATAKRSHRHPISDALIARDGEDSSGGTYETLNICFVNGRTALRLVARKFAECDWQNAGRVHGARRR